MSSASLHTPTTAPLHTTASDMQALLGRPTQATTPPPSSAEWLGGALGTVCRQMPDGCFMVELQGDGAPLYCPRAASCLLMPSVGDVVLVAGPQPTQSYLIALITQADSGHARVVVDGDLSLQARGGAITLQADTQLALESPGLALRTDRAEMHIDDLEYRGSEARISTLVARFVGRTCEAVLDRLSVLTRSSFRLTEEVEQVRAGQIDMQAEQTLRMHSKNTLLTSKGLVKVDAEQIHMG